MQRTMLKSKIHRAKVTQADLEYEGSISIDKDLMDAADIYENEKVSVWNVTAGTRFDTYAIYGEAGSGCVCVNGAAARLVAVNDLVIVACFANYEQAEAEKHKPKVLLMDEHNRIKGSETQLRLTR